jgi:cobalt-precorrin-5B (C1)-methyltransferase
MERYIEKNSKRLRYGYTTGSCAAAAAKAAVLALYEEKVSVIDIDTPKGWNITIDVFYEVCQKGTHSYVIKDAGDDPDVTHGIKIHAIARKSPGEEPIRIQAGVGIGIVTKKGLSVEVGEPAINPVPLQMIRTEVNKVLPSQESVTISIFVPEGIEIAKRTFNKKLGILGGISILGTTGIVEPMSEKALLDTFNLNYSSSFI